MNAFARPKTLEEAVALMAQAPHLVMAGGTDIFPSAGSRLQGEIVDLSGIIGLNGISHKAGLRIGACTTWTQIAEANLPTSCRALQLAARQVGGRQIQNVGTIGGNLCNASPAADGVPALLALDASVELFGPDGARNLALSDFMIGPRKTALRRGEIMTAVLVPTEALEGRSTFLKLGARAYLVISIAMVAARVCVQNGRIQSSAIAVGSCSAAATRLRELEASLTGLAVDEALDEMKSANVANALSPISDVRATADYRTAAATNLVRRAVSEVLI